MKITHKIVLAALLAQAAFAGTCPATLTAAVTPLNIGAFDSKHVPGYYLQVKVANSNQLEAAEIELNRSYSDSTLASARPTGTIRLEMIKNGGFTTGMFNNELINDKPLNSTVWIERVSFSNGTVWQDDGTHACSANSGILSSGASYASR